MEFCVLGTKAGGVPLVKKHSSATFLRLGAELVLFDCAENTQVQLLRAGTSWAHINHIFISHLHGDHILGLPPLLSTMNGDRRTAPLHLYAPKGLEEYLRLGMRIMDVQPHFDLNFTTLEEGFSGELAQIRGCTVHARMLEHRITSFGFRVQEQEQAHIDTEKLRVLGLESDKRIGIIKREGSITLDNGRTISLADIAAAPRKPRSFVYCGDTRVCDAVVELAKNATVMLHEATFDASMTDKATERYHCTSRQAAEHAVKAGVERLFLTHFSVRYKSAIPLIREARKVFPQTFMAKELKLEKV
ncbi:MAG: ribonuclease Z [Candidatus Kapaibacterium sp.]|nr:MAG: ribonuclease Z [Candidatus Kapabacteria bacterium]